MGFYLRKSFSFGPFRFNFSGSGVGVSAGVRGLRIGSGPRGNYVHVGRGGIYYRHNFRSDVTPHASPQEIDSGDAAPIVDSSSEELLDEIRAKRRKLALRPLAVTFTIVLLILALLSGSGWALLFAAVVGIGAIVFPS